MDNFLRSILGIPVLEVAASMICPVRYIRIRTTINSSGILLFTVNFFKINKAVYPMRN